MKLKLIKDKYDALVCTGRLEFQLQGQSQNVLDELKHFQRFVAKDDYVNATMSFWHFIELIEENKNLVEVSMIAGFLSLSKLLNESIEKLNLSTRSTNALRRSSINLVRDLIEIPKKDFLQGKTAEGKNIRNLGSQSIQEILNKLESLGLEMKY